jgi:hypothetical protein
LVLNIPEWEVEDALAWDPKLLDDFPEIHDIKLIQRQKYLPRLGRYIDLLFRSQDKLVLVEVKSGDIKDDQVIRDQILPYKNELVNTYKIPPNQIIAVLAFVGNISENVEKKFKENRIIIKQIRSDDIIKSKPPSRNILIKIQELEKTYDLLKRRGFTIDKNDIQRKITIYPEIRSVQTWIAEGLHDYLGKEHIAAIFNEISTSSPIMAHEIGMDTNGKLNDFIDMWFWLFYSVLDRRANAANFIRAREALEKENLFHPKQINKFVEKNGEPDTIAFIAEILRKNNFPLLVDKSYGNFTNPKSIVDAAKFISKYDYDFRKIYSIHSERGQGNQEVIFQSLWIDIKDNIYGVGERITAQFIRGMVLKGPWSLLPLTNDVFLEKCGFNETFAGPLRLNLAQKENYNQDLSAFAKEFLDGNRAILSHVLWYIRRKYCHRRPDCMNCKLSGYCRHYLKIQYNDMFTTKKRTSVLIHNSNNQFQSTLKSFSRELLDLEEP